MSAEDKTPSRQQELDILVRQAVQIVGFLTETERSEYINALLGEVFLQLANRKQLVLKEEDKTELVKKAIAVITTARSQISA